MWYPLVIPLLLQAPVAFLGFVLWKYFDTSKERQNIRKAFGFYLPENIIDQLVKNISPAESAAERVYGVCLDSQTYEVDFQATTALRSRRRAPGASGVG